MHGNKDYIISVSLLLILVRRLKHSSLTFAILAKKCLSLSFPGQETGDFGLDARQKLKQCWVRMEAGALIVLPAMTARRESQLSLRTWPLSMSIISREKQEYILKHSLLIECLLVSPQSYNYDKIQSSSQGTHNLVGRIDM